MGKIIPESRLFRKDLAGGAILDVGLYPISFSRLIAGAALGKKFVNPLSLSAEARISDTGVAEIAKAILKFDNNIEAHPVVNWSIIIFSAQNILFFIYWEPLIKFIDKSIRLWPGNS